MSKRQEQQARPPQHQEDQPGHRQPMEPTPQAQDPSYRGSGKLQDRVALITGGDSGIGRAVAIAFAREGADIAIVYFDEHEDAKSAQKKVEQENRRCIIISGDIGDEAFCQQAVQQTVDQLGKLDILINNAAEQYPKDSITEISSEQLEQTFRTNIFAMFYLTKAALPHLGKGSAIVNTTSVTAYAGSPHLLDYSATKGAIVAFTRSLSGSLVDQGIRVNAVAPGPIWTPLIPATFSAEHVASFGSDVPMKRAGQPEEIAPSYVFLASDDASYMSGQVLHPNGGEIVAG
jgi:NAD(P)-dependent dehydrogenase (short-subunit alcohol dehydrogenase family)